MSRWIFMFLPRSLCEDVISRLESHVSPSGDSCHNHQPTQASLSTGCIGHVSTPSPCLQKHSHLYYLFFSGRHWPNCSGSIFQPAAFVSKQLYLWGYGLFSPALSLLFYRLSLSFGSVAYGTYDSGCGADVGNQRSMCWAECGSKEEMFCVSRKRRERGKTQNMWKIRMQSNCLIKVKMWTLFSCVLSKPFELAMTIHTMWHNLASLESNTIVLTYKTTHNYYRFHAVVCEDIENLKFNCTTSDRKSVV